MKDQTTTMILILLLALAFFYVQKAPEEEGMVGIKVHYYDKDRNEIFPNEKPKTSLLDNLFGLYTPLLPFVSAEEIDERIESDVEPNDVLHNFLDNLFLVMKNLFSTFTFLAATTTKLYPIDDAHVKEQYETSNYGDYTILDIKNQDNYPDQDIYTYLKFNTGTIPSGAQISSAYMKLYLKGCDPSIWEPKLSSAADNWEEETVTWNKRPGGRATNSFGWTGGSIYDDDVGSWITLNYNLASFLNNERALGHNIVSFRVWMAEDDEEYVTFYSEESSSHDPYLYVTYTTTCTPHDFYGCYNNDIYWYDSCGVREELKEDCGVGGCEIGYDICNEPVCDPHDSYSCYSNDVYWYDSCGVREEKKQECGSDGYTGSNYCYNGDVYKDYIDNGCSGSSCTQSTSKVKQEDCGGLGCTGGVCNTEEEPVYISFEIIGTAEENPISNIQIEGATPTPFETSLAGATLQSLLAGETKTLWTSGFIKIDDVAEQTIWIKISGIDGYTGETIYAENSLGEEPPEEPGGIEGEYVSEWSALSDSWGITTDGINIWTTDGGGYKVCKYDMNGNQVGYWQTSKFSIQGITTNGINIWTVHKNDDTVHKYDMNGNLHSAWNTLGEGYGPRGITTDGNYIWVTLGYEDSEAVYKYNMNGIYQNEYWEGGNPRGITTDGINIWTVHKNPDETSMIYKFDMNGNHVGSWEPISRARDITTDGNYFWTTSQYSSMIEKYEFGGV